MPKTTKKPTAPYNTASDTTATSTSASRAKAFHPDAPDGAQRALILAIERPDVERRAAEASRTELVRLAGTLGIEVARTVTQKRDTPAPSYLGEGKLRELARALEDDVEMPSNVALVDDELTPGQQRLLGAVLGLPVLDRTAIILRIFERRAQTSRAKLEVEIARLTYDLPRLRDDLEVADKQGGGAGRGERGHTAVELAKQQVRQRLSQLRKTLAQQQKVLERRREGARPSEVSRVALVGYTNAGKSSWMRVLTGSHVYVEDKLFATLGVTTRPVHPASRPRVLVTDTVGFIQRLPHNLVASFRSTLDEAREADRLLVVVDASDPDWTAQLDTVRDTLHSIGAEAPQQLVFNKIDCVSAAGRQALADAWPDAWQVSSHDASDVAWLRQALVTSLSESLAEADLEVPYALSAITAEIRGHACVLEEQYTETSTRLRIRAPRRAVERWRAAMR